MPNATKELIDARHDVESVLDRIDAVYGQPNGILDVTWVRNKLTSTVERIKRLQYGGVPPAESKPSRMSGDRVRLVIPERYLTNGKVIQAVKQAFGLTDDEIHSARVRDHYGNRGLEVICRPSQFGRFVILRNESGTANSIKDLEPELFFPKPAESPIDVSRRKNDYNAPMKEV